MDDQFDRLKAALADHYAIEREIGSGGMATVYLAEDLKHHRKVAVKVLRPEIASALGADRFVREIEIAANLSHPLILPLHDSGEADGNLFYVMPFVEGESLRERIDRDGKLPLDEIVRLTENVAAALTYAHQNGIVHRDVKPENIMLTGGSAVVADFGIARAVSVAGGTRLTETGVAIGTPAYMSPEQAFGDANIDGRSDVYALGCVAYEMASGRVPFEAPTPQAMLAKHAVDTPRSLRTIDPTMPLFLERAVSRALAKEPAQRFKTPNELAEILRSQTVIAQVGRRRLAVLPPTNLTNDPEQEYFVQGMHNALISELQKVGIAVIARTSVLQYENTQKPIRNIAAELGVDALLEPSVFRTGNSVELEVRVVDGTTEEYLADPISRGGELQNVAALVRGLTSAIAAEIQVALTPEAEARLASVRTVNPEAYEAYLKGQVYLATFGQTEMETALEYFERARNIDPDYALAYAGIGMTWAVRQQIGFVPHSESAPRIRAAVARALELDSTLVEVQVALAGAKTWTDWDWVEGEAAFRRAIELNPNHPDVRANYAHFLCMMLRHDEAMPQAERAVELDPFNPMSQNHYGWVLYFVRRYDDAIAQFKNLHRMAPNHPGASYGLSHVYHQKGMYDESLAAVQSGFYLMGQMQVEEALASGYAEGGYRGARRHLGDMLATRRNETYVLPTDIAMAYSLAGEISQAVDWLELGFEEHDPYMAYLSGDPVFDPLREDPRFQDLLRRMNLPE